MKKVILGLIAFSTIAASAATARLGSAHFESGDGQVTIDARAVSGLKEVTLQVKGETLHLGEVRIVFRTGNGWGKYQSQLYRVNQVVAKGGAVTLDLPANSLPIRRIEIEASSAGFNRSASIIAYGSN